MRGTVHLHRKYIFLRQAGYYHAKVWLLWHHTVLDCYVIHCSPAGGAGGRSGLQAAELSSSNTRSNHQLPAAEVRAANLPLRTKQIHCGVGGQ